MKRHDDQRLSDVLAATVAIRTHLGRGDLSDGLIFDAVRICLLEVREAVKGLSSELLATEPTIAWKQIAAMRDQLAHRYFDTSHDRCRDGSQRSGRVGSGRLTSH